MTDNISRTTVLDERITYRTPDKLDKHSERDESVEKNYQISYKKSVFTYTASYHSRKRYRNDIEWGSQNRKNLVLDPYKDDMIRGGVINFVLKALRKGRR